MVQIHLRGIYNKPFDTCPHIQKQEEGPNLCYDPGGSNPVCAYERGERCELFVEIIHEWQQEMDVETIGEIRDYIPKEV